VITIVSGLPRSGTSLMMQMLAAGGVPILSDGKRVADTDNPRGYCEWERIKRLPQEPSCIDDAEGRAVKVISQLLFALPAGRSYRVVFMERPLPEVVASQAEMIRRRGTSGASVPEAALIAGLRAHLNQVNAWLAQRSEILMRRQTYHDVLRDPAGASQGIRTFLDRELDIAAMTKQVDSSLYRNRTNEAAIKS
jgi:hypothetical protein